MTPEAGSGPPETVRRERLVSAAAFAVAAALFDLVGVALTMGFTGLIREGPTTLLLSPFAVALPVAVAGWAAGPRLARATDSLEAAVVGMAVTLGAVLLYLIAGGAFVSLSVVIDGGGLSSVSDAFDEGSISSVLRGVATAGIWLVIYSSVAGLVAAPFGAFGAVVAWRQIHRSDPTEPV